MGWKHSLFRTARVFYEFFCWCHAILDFFMHLELHALPQSSCSFWKQPLPNALTRKPKALCQMPSYDTYWYTYAKSLCWLPRLLHCRCLSHGFVGGTISGSYAEHMNQSCPRITPSAHRGEGTQDRTLLNSSGTMKPQKDPKKCVSSSYPINFFFSY